MDADDCFKRGLLRAIRRQPDLAQKDLERAAFFLREAEDLFRIGKEVMASIALYNGYFHAARALLFKDGVRERSHYCIARYLESRYVRNGLLSSRMLDAFETMLAIRQSAQYSAEEAFCEEDLSELTAMCAGFLERIAELLQPRPSATPRS